ncbi:glycine-rich protein A3-like [Pyrus communis]|uniref:glycine-rich protein A3-like n=1 Tax=Pyrus communis TaxID=23211 RepID=UPI0035BECF45
MPASSSSNPPSTGQQVLSTGFPNPICTKPPRTSTQNPSFSASIGHVAGDLAGGGFKPGKLPPPPGLLPPPQGQPPLQPPLPPPPLPPPPGGLPV